MHTQLMLHSPPPSTGSSLEIQALHFRFCLAALEKNWRESLGQFCMWYGGTVTLRSTGCKGTCQMECLCIANGPRERERWHTETYRFVVHQAQLQQLTGYTSSHSFAETQELMGATKICGHAMIGKGTPLKTSIFSKRNSSLLCHNCPTHLIHSHTLKS